MENLRMLEVGKLFQKGKTHYPEGTKFDVTDSGINFIAFYDRPTSKEKEAFKKGSIQYGFTEIDNVLMMLFRFGSQHWMDVPYNVQLSKNLTHLEQVGQGDGFALHIYLVDAATGILKVQRLVGLDSGFSRIFRENLIQQSKADLSNYQSILQAIFNTYQTEDLVAKAKIIVQK